MKSFSELTPREILALAISSEEEDARIYMAFAEDLRERYPASAKVFEEMAEEEVSHRHMLLSLNPRTALCRCLCDAEQLGNILGWHGSFDRLRH